MGSSPTAGSTGPGYADLHTVKRLGRARLPRFLQRHSRGAWGEAEPDTIIAGANATLELWGDELEFADLADESPSRPAWRSP